MVVSKLSGGRHSSDGDTDVGGRCRPISDVVITNRGTKSHEKKDSTVDKTILHDYKEMHKYAN